MSGPELTDEYFIFSAKCWKKFLSNWRDFCYKLFLRICLRWAPQRREYYRLEGEWVSGGLSAIKSILQFSSFSSPPFDIIYFSFSSNSLLWTSFHTQEVIFSPLGFSDNPIPASAEGASYPNGWIGGWEGGGKKGPSIFIKYEHKKQAKCAYTKNDLKSFLKLLNPKFWAT